MARLCRDGMRDLLYRLFFMCHVKGLCIVVEVKPQKNTPLGVFFNITVAFRQVGFLTFAKTCMRFRNL